MSRDSLIEAIFTTADDAMQGLWGFHRYLKAAADITQPQDLAPLLPQGSFQLTHHWERMYAPHDCLKAINHTGIDFLLSRSSLVSLVAISEAALNRFNCRLVRLGKAQEEAKNKRLLRWAFELVKDSRLGSPAMLVRLPQTCGDLDNARRLRNCIVHNNGKYDREMYVDDAIQDGWTMVQNEKSSAEGVLRREPIFLITERFEYFCRSHIEFLHILHNTAQNKYFGHSAGYNYAQEGKDIEWCRILSGRNAAGM